MPATITSIAHFVPPDIYDNNYFASYLDTSDEWIMQRTGIKERHFLKEGATSDMIIPAAKKCLEKRGLTPQDIDCVLVCTVTPDHSFPITAAIVQHKLGIDKAWGFDMNAACSSFVFALVTACKLVEGGAAKRVLLCGGDKMTSIMNPDDRNQAVLFGDGAGVAIIEMSDDPNMGLRDHILNIDGSGEKHLKMFAGGSARPATIETVTNKEHYIHQEGQAVFKAAVKGMADVSVEIMEKNNLKSEDIKWLIPHQANLRIIKATADRMKISENQVKVNIERYGNTTSATIPICISELSDDKQLNDGDNIVLASFGAGFTWGAVYFKWHTNGH
jgi:3-oxoacyl-[acyl-carrier-protein] synthase-3